jgi:type II secretory ATPase GspE/PulE/Tfp pilus assembly ATPase PilB-like protein
MSPGLQKAIQGEDITTYEIEQEALKHGTVLMSQDGVLKALDGETTLEEVFRVTG